MTLSMTPHVNFSSKEDIVELFSGCNLVDFCGSALWSGWFATLMPPIQWGLKLNSFLGYLFPKYAAGYYFVFTRKE